MGNKKLSTDMARYIWSIIAKEPLLPMSWGVDLETVVCSEDALEFHVQGFLHTGNVRIVYIEGADIFQVLLYDEEGNLLKQIDDVYLDNLAETIDLNVENDKAKNNPNNKRAVAFLKVMISQDKSLQEMTNILNNEGFVTAQGCRFVPATVKRLIKRYNLK